MMSINETEECICGWCQDCFDRFEQEASDNFQDQTKDMICKGCGFCTECSEILKN